MEIRKVSDFTNSLTTVNSIHYKEIFFRGHSDKSYKLKPSLYRKEKYYYCEEKIFKDIILNCPQDFQNCRSTIEVLVKMQHYGVPTRILDLTRNALVALYFACSTNETKDGEVVLLNIPKKDICYFDSDKVSILSNLSKQNALFNYNYDKSFNYKNKTEVDYINKEHFGYLLHSIKEEKPHFQDIINPKDIESVFAVNAKLDNPRIIRQSGAFLIFGCKKNKLNPSQLKRSWILKPNNQRIIIPSHYKNDILKELNVLGINTSTLFPELENQANFIKQKYKFKDFI